MAKKMKFPSLDLPLLKMIGPSIVSLGLGLGSGEYILWPFLAAHYGFGILWGALLGISIQLLLILEIQRYSSVKGEDIVTGLGRVSRLFPPLLILGTVIGFGWPGFAATSSQLILSLTGAIPYAGWLPPLILVVCAAILLIGRNVYSKIEPIQSTIVILSFMSLIYLFIRLFDADFFMQAVRGFAGQGNGYSFIPEGLDLSVFIGAIAYAGTGGTLILSQSFYTIEEGHGLARYAKKFNLWLRKDEVEKEELEPVTDKKSLFNFRHLLSIQRFEGFALFWGMGLLTIFMLSYIAFVTVHGDPSLSSGFDFLIQEAGVLSTLVAPIWGKVFIAIGILALISVQLGIFDMMGRISAIAIQNLYPKLKLSHNRLYVWAVVVQLLIGLSVFGLGFQEPLWLIVTGAVINAFTMAVISIGVALLNRRVLPQGYKSSKLISGIILLASLFYLTLLAVNIFA